MNRYSEHSLKIQRLIEDKNKIEIALLDNKSEIELQKQRGCKQQLPIKEAYLHVFKGEEIAIHTYVQERVPHSSGMFGLGQTGGVNDGKKAN